MPKLLRELKAFYKKEGRGHLPWRKTHDPYKILVSEIMLQQTQVARVVGYYERWIQKFPTAKKLANAKLSEVLKEWQGLGYNRRAKFLHEAAKKLSRPATLFSGETRNISWGSPTPARRVAGRLSVQVLESLPGVGPYTARAVAAFAYNSPEVFIETNIRTVFFHSNILQNSRIDSKKTVARTTLATIDDKDLLPLVAEALNKSKMEPRDFYAALMDYGSYLKSTGVRTNSKSKHYTKQSKFEGSARQLRGAILRELLKGPKTLKQLIKNLSPRTREEVKRELERLKSEKLVRQAGKLHRIAG